MLDQDQDGFVSFVDFVKKIRVLLWFLAPGQNKKIKETLSGGGSVVSNRPPGTTVLTNQSSEDYFSALDLKSLCLGIVIGMVSTVISMRVLSHY